jgi:transcriptional regulator with XRE-family HTH domain
VAQTLGQWLREQRRSKAWTQKEAARQLGIAQASISDIETEATLQPQAETLQKLAAGFKVAVEFLRTLIPEQIETEVNPVEFWADPDLRSVFLVFLQKPLAPIQPATLGDLETALENFLKRPETRCYMVLPFRRNEGAGEVLDARAEDVMGGVQSYLTRVRSFAGCGPRVRCFARPASAECPELFPIVPLTFVFAHYEYPAEEPGNAPRVATKLLGFLHWPGFQRRLVLLSSDIYDPDLDSPVVLSDRELILQFREFLRPLPEFIRLKEANTPLPDSTKWIELRPV